MGLLKKILGSGIAAAGALTGQPQLVISGGTMVAGDFAADASKGGKKGSPKLVSQGRQGTIPGATPPPKVAHSLDERRVMNRERMSRVYGVNG